MLFMVHKKKKEKKKKKKKKKGALVTLHLVSEKLEKLDSRYLFSTASVFSSFFVHHSREESVFI